MNKTTEALKLSTVALKDIACTSQTDDLLWWQIRAREALAAIREALAEQETQKPVAFKFPREPKPENAMGWIVDYGLIRDIAEAIGDQEFHPGYEGIELTLIALERIYAAPVSAKAIQHCPCCGSDYFAGSSMVDLDKAIKNDPLYLQGRAEALEEAAKVCEEHGPKEGSMRLISDGFAAAIRARGEK